jgi:hypothetical protein
MIAALTLSLICAPSAGAVCLPDFSVVAFQGEDLKELIKRFDVILKSKVNEGEAIKLMDDFVLRYRTLQNEITAIDDNLEIGEGDAKQQKVDRKAKVKDLEKIAETVYKSFVHKGRKNVTEGNLQMWKAAAYTLGQMGENGGTYLLKAFELKKFRDEPELRGLCLEQIGYTHAYKKFADELIDLLDHSEYLFIAKAADALAQFGEAPAKIRKLAIERMSKLLAQNYEATITDKRDEEAQRKYRMTGRSMQNSLEALAHVSLDGPLDWTEWWNKNKNKADVWSDE